MRDEPSTASHSGEIAGTRVAEEPGISQVLGGHDAWGSSDRGDRARTSAMVIIATGVALGLAWWLRPILVPIAFAWLLKVAFTPLVRAARRYGVQPPVTAALIIVGGIFTTGAAVYFLAGPAAGWVKTLPGDLQGVKERLERVRGGGTPLDDVADSIEDISNVGDDVDEARPIVVEVKPSTPSMFTALWTAQGYLAQGLLIAILAYFMLANDRGLLTKWVELSNTRAGRRRAIRTMRAIESHCSRYIATISAINFALGVAVGLACSLTGLGQPILWGIMAMILNFVPFLGAAIGIGIVALASITTIESFPEALYPTACYVTLTCIEGMVITPAIIGRQIRLSPVAVLFWLILWGWLWGFAGALLALPMLAAVVIVCRNVPEWRGIARLVEA